MYVPRQSESGPDAGKWYIVVVEGKAAVRRAGYCAAGCAGHDTREDALAHQLQYQLEREVDLWLDRRAPTAQCEICGESTTLRARLGRKTKLFVLCTRHQSTSSLQVLSRRRAALLPVQ